MSECKVKYFTKPTRQPPNYWPGGKSYLEDKWYWRDASCEEDIGPFDTQEEAEKDAKVFSNPFAFRLKTPPKMGVLSDD